jgi:hypothetical protein
VTAATRERAAEIFLALSTVAIDERLAALVAQWPPEQPERLAAVLRNLAKALVPGGPRNTA